LLILFILATLRLTWLNFLVLRALAMNLFLNLDFKRLNLMRFLMSMCLLQVPAPLTTRPFLSPVVQRTLRLIRFPERAHTILASTTICIILASV
jgi:hypothetical protein